MRKWHFSLRTLLILVLSLAAGAALWKNAEPWRIERAFSGFDDECHTVLLSPDGKWVLGQRNHGTPNGRYDAVTCKLWNVKTGELTDLSPTIHSRAVASDRALSQNRFVSTDFSPDSRFVLSSLATRNEYAFKLWNLETGSEVVLPTEPLAMRHIHFSPDGRRLLRFTMSGLKLFELPSGKLVLEQEAVNSAKFSADGSLLALAYKDKSIQIFASEDSRLVHHLKTSEPGEFSGIQHVSQEQVFAYLEWTDPDSSAKAKKRKIHRTLVFDLKQPDAPPRSLAGYFMSAAPNGKVGIIGTTDDVSFIELHAAEPYADTHLSHSRFTEIWSPDSSQVFNPLKLELYDVRTGGCLYALDGNYGVPMAGFTRVVARTHEKRGAASAVYDMRDGRLLQVLPNATVDFGIDFPSEHFVTQNTKTNAIHYWSRYRPEAWWGLFWLPEMWLCVVLVGVLIWSVRRD